jgi:hypothetical protein
MPYATWDADYRATAIDPVLNKIEQLLSAPAVRATVGTLPLPLNSGSACGARPENSGHSHRMVLFMLRSWRAPMMLTDLA